MSEVATQVRDWQQGARPVSIVRVISTRGFSSRDRDPLAAFTPGQPASGTVLAGAIDGPLQQRFEAAPQLRAMLDLGISDEAATGVGLSCGGSARLLVQPAADIDDAGWAALASGAPTCLITVLRSEPDSDLPAIGTTELFTADTIDGAEQRYGPGVRRLFARGISQTTLLKSEAAWVVVTSVWPVPTMVVVGEGLIAQALAAANGLLGWSTQIINDGDEAALAIAGLNHADAVVVLSHDRTVDGPAFVAALGSETGYIGGLGSARTQAARSEWLGERGVPAADIARIYGPAGLDIGAFTPAEIATSITAEVIAVRSGVSGGSLQGRLGPIRAS